MKRCVTIVVLAGLLWPLLAGELAAGGWPRREPLLRRSGMYSGRTAAPLPAPTARPYPTAEELYPKYYGGFHYRHLDNIGVPRGDVGIRGNGFYSSPW